MSDAEEGFLVVLSDVKAEQDEDYLAWLTTEHVHERLGIPGFLAVRIFMRPIEGGCQYFIWYELRNADVVDSAAYLDRLNNPTPWSRRIMPILGNFGRAGGTVKARRRKEPAGLIMAIGFDAAPSRPENLLEGVAAASGIRSVHFLETDRKKTELRTNERDLRTSDNTFAGLLLLESDDRELLHAASATAALAEAPGIVRIYQQIFSLRG